MVTTEPRMKGDERVICVVEEWSKERKRKGKSLSRV